MSLATRCTSCKTVFRVVQEQLKVSEGWVRCGRCSTVFNALNALFDLERNAAAKPPPPAPSRLPASKILRETGPAKPELERGPPAAVKPPSVKPKEPPLGSLRRGSPPLDSPPLARRRSDGNPSGRLEGKPRGHVDFADAQFDPDILSHEIASDILAAPPKPSATPSAAPSADYHAETIIAGTELLPDGNNGTESTFEPATLEFVRLAERQAHWQSPRMRAIVAAASVALTSVLALQVVYHFRDLTAARYPWTAPALTGWCRLAGCQVAPPRSIDSVVVESTTLERQTHSTEAFLLSVVLRNQSNYAVALPSIDLSLRDASGLLVTRRMLHPAELNIQARALEPEAETQIQMQLIDKEQRIVGYTVEAFYP